VLLVARTEIGVCSVALGDDETILESALREEFSRAEIVRDDEGLRHTLETVLSSTKGDVDWSQLPLDVRVTAFQARVWRELQKLKARRNRFLQRISDAFGCAEIGARGRGGVRTKSRRSGASMPSRGRERWRSDGYRWGLKRKRLLLELERKTGE
jgi:AraC family transcriptional regulator of adaptative response/methylated-DNA-[protein]-cysteine methyltransferase